MFWNRNKEVERWKKSAEFWKQEVEQYNRLDDELRNGLDIRLEYINDVYPPADEDAEFKMLGDCVSEYKSGVFYFDGASWHLGSFGDPDTARKILCLPKKTEGE